MEGTGGDIAMVPTSDHTPNILARRSPEEVALAAKDAGVTGSVGRVQLLQFSPQLHGDDIQLMEVHGEVLAALRNRERVVIRGSCDDEAVVCTNNKTFELRVADTSNALLIAPSLNLPQTHDCGNDGELRSCEVRACLSSYLELRPCHPRIEKLKELLSERLFRGLEYEEEGEGEESQGTGGGESVEMGEDGRRQGRRQKGQRKYSFEDLLHLVQASEDELYKALKDLQACPILGFWRCFDLDYRDMVVQQVMALLEEKDWSYQRVPMEATCQALSELEPRFAIEHCVCCYGDRLEEANSMPSVDNDVYYQLSEEKICQFYAELLLRPAGKFNYQEFILSWKQSVPEGMKTSLEYLKGLALTDMSSVPPVIWYFPVADLPHDPPGKFLRLFEVREKWLYEDMEPYIRDLEMPSQSLKGFLMKYARVSTDTRGQKLYSRK